MHAQQKQAFNYGVCSFPQQATNVSIWHYFGGECWGVFQTVALWLISSVEKSLWNAYLNYNRHFKGSKLLKTLCLFCEITTVIVLV